jgi:hypothetical protein
MVAQLPLIGLALDHRAELLDSAISPGLVDHLVDGGHLQTIEGNYEIAKFLNRKFARFSWKQIHQQQRGWAFQGLDPHTWEPMSWGCLKPDSPRLDPAKPGKSIKYEVPVGESQRVFVVPSPAINWPKVAADRTVPRLLTEGFKKSACLVSHGYAALGLSGVWTGVRKIESGQYELSPDLQPFALPGSPWLIVFDKDSKPDTVHNVALAQIAQGKTLEDLGCSVKVVQLPGPEKGVDDFILARGVEAFEQLIREAVSLEDFRAEVFDPALIKLRQEPTVTLSSRYLDVELPNEGLIAICSPMGTGKTELLKRVLKNTPSCLSLTHRVTLGRQAASRLDLLLYSDINVGRDDHARKLEITVDSLGKLPTLNNRYHTIVLDEVEQVLHHLMTSSTCKKSRAVIMQRLAYFVQTATRVIALQAELSDATLSYLQKLRKGEAPYIVVNDQQPEPRLISWYEQNKPDQAIADLLDSIRAGERPMIACSSKNRAKLLERLLLREFPDLKLRVIHGDNSGDPDSVDFLEHVNERALDVQALIFTPSMSTGVSIDVEAFTVVYGVFDSADFHASELLQMLGRYRPRCPWMIWSASRGAGNIGSSDPDDLIKEELEKNRRTGVLTEIDTETGVEGGPHLELWAELAARTNASKRRQREVLSKLLRQLGHYLFSSSEKPTTDIESLISTCRDEVKQASAEAIANAPDISDKEAEKLLFSRQNLSEEDRNKLLKFKLATGYQMPVTVDLVKLDNNGRLLNGIIALEELLDPDLALERDRKDFELHKFKPDRRHRTLKRWYREKLGLLRFLNPCREWDNLALENDGLGELIASHRLDISKTLGLTIPESKSSCWILSHLLQQLGIKTRSRREGGRGAQERIYSLDWETWEFARETIERRRQHRLKRSNPDGSQTPLYGDQMSQEGEPCP